MIFSYYKLEMNSVKNFEIEGFKCCCIPREGSDTLTFMIYPALEMLDYKWLEKVSADYGVAIACVFVPADKWNDVLTPWAEPPEAPTYPPFAGKAKEFLDLLLSKIVPAAEEACQTSANVNKDLIGVSLSGLFTLWQWIQDDTFRNIASLSGSFWYHGFIEWFESQQLPHKAGKAFFLLGVDEPKAHVVAYRSVGVDTEKIVSLLKEAGVDVEFEWVPGNHFSRPLHRALQAFDHLYPDPLRK